MSGEGVVFFACVGVGAASCILYAIFWILELMLKNKIANAVFDVLFVASSAAAYFFCLLKTTWGEFRIYTLFAYVLGFAGFYFALKPFAKKAAKLVEKIKGKRVLIKFKRFKKNEESELTHQS